ncbi:MAG TPA: protein phosphatase 2C domain-containing protein [Chthonomonadaceae bacterium]|nr:protein phosphatase 2C domain-containing protein [Chthonomonadaceae bacterium]
MKLLQAQAEFELKCDPRTNESDLQLDELPRAAANNVMGRVLLGYRRCLEKDDRNGEGEDYAWLFAGRDCVLAALADGVSQSFFGQIAAQQVVNGLAQYLRNGNRLEVPRKQALIQALRGIAQEGAHGVARYPLRQGLSSTMIELLEEERIKGSEAVFGAFVFDRTNRRLAVCQVGDIRIRVFLQDARGGIVSHLVPANKRGRFSTVATANPGDPALERDLVIQSFDNVLGVLVHSDGVDDHWGEEPAALDPQQEEKLRIALNCWAAKDDVSVVGVLTDPLLKWTAHHKLILPEDRAGTSRFPSPERETSGYSHPGPVPAPDSGIENPWAASPTLRPVEPAQRPVGVAVPSYPSPRAMPVMPAPAEPPRRVPLPQYLTLGVCALCLLSAAFLTGRLTAPSRAQDAGTSSGSASARQPQPGRGSQITGAPQDNKTPNDPAQAVAAILHDPDSEYSKLCEAMKAQHLQEFVDIRANLQNALKAASDKAKGAKSDQEKKDLNKEMKRIQEAIVKVQTMIDVLKQQPFKYYDPKE